MMCKEPHQWNLSLLVVLVLVVILVIDAALAAEGQARL